MYKALYLHQYSSKKIKYDLLLIDIGSRPAIEDISGATSFGCVIKPIKKILQNWWLWLKLKFESKRKRPVVVVGGGAADIEVLLVMQYRLQKTTSINVQFYIDLC